MEETFKELRKKYIDKFNDYFPNIKMSQERELEILKNCLKREKDAYELGYFDRYSDKLY